MSINEKITAIIQDVNAILSKQTPISSKKFIKLAVRLMNMSDLALN